MSKIAPSELQTLVTALVSKDFTHEQLGEVREAFNFAMKRSSQSIKRSLARNDRVTFTTKRGERVSGKVIKILRKNVSVQQDNSPIVWRVSPNLLRKL